MTKLKLPNLKLTSLIAIMTLATTLTACNNPSDSANDSVNETAKDTVNNSAENTTPQTEESAKTTEAAIHEQAETKNSDSDEPFSHIKIGEPVQNPENFTIDGKPSSISDLTPKSASEITSDGLENSSESSTANEVAMEALMMADEIEGTEENSDNAKEQ